MREVVKTIMLYECEICLTKYEKKEDAIRCEGCGVEEEILQVGDRVTNVGLRTCSFQGREENYIFKGKVVEVKGPNPPDKEYEYKWLGGKKERLNSHVFSYIVEYICPICRKKKSAMYYTPELLKVIKKK